MLTRERRDFLSHHHECKEQKSRKSLSRPHVALSRREISTAENRSISVTELDEKTRKELKCTLEQVASNFSNEERPVCRICMYFQKYSNNMLLFLKAKVSGMCFGMFIIVI